MKHSAFFSFALGFLLAGCGPKDVPQVSAAKSSPPSAAAAPAALDPPPVTAPSPAPAATPVVAVAAIPPAAIPAALPALLFKWNLHPEDIRYEFEQTGRVVRTKAPDTGTPAGTVDGDALASLIGAKFQTDARLSTLKLVVAVDRGVATLSGSAHSLDDIGEAMVLTLDTEGVTRAVSLITMAP